MPYLRLVLTLVIGLTAFITFHSNSVIARDVIPDCDDAYGYCVAVGCIGGADTCGFVYCDGGTGNPDDNMYICSSTLIWI